jgi:hypothetical protein
MKFTYLDRGSGGPQSRSEGFRDKKIFFLLREKEPQFLFHLIPCLIHCTDIVGQTSEIKVNYFSFIGLNTSLVTDVKGGVADSYNVENVAENVCWKS